MTTLPSAEVVEAFRLGDITVQIVQREADGYTHKAARFSPTPDEAPSAPEFGFSELTELADAVLAAMVLFRHLERKITTVELAEQFAKLRREHNIAEAAR